MAAMNKRKRESHDIAGGRAAPAMAQTGDEFESHYLHTDDGMDGAGAVMDFSAAFTQHGDDGTNQQGDGKSASDTAAAAMAQYHTMTVPQSTEQSFMTGTEGDKQTGSADQSGSNVQHRNSSFGDFDTSAIQSSPNGETSPTNPNASMSTPKPPVGSEEWHKVRKDNHKEGMLTEMTMRAKTRILTCK